MVLPLSRYDKTARYFLAAVHLAASRSTRHVGIGADRQLSLRWPVSGRKNTSAIVRTAEIIYAGAGMDGVTAILRVRLYRRDQRVASVIASRKSPVRYEGTGLPGLRPRTAATVPGTVNEFGAVSGSPRRCAQKE
jgi:hypothetical protein